MANSDWTMQRLADLLGSTVDRPQIKETTALGAAYLAGLHAGFFPEPDRFLEHWRLERRFTPHMGCRHARAKAHGLDGRRSAIAGVGPSLACLRQQRRSNRLKPLKPLHRKAKLSEAANRRRNLTAPDALLRTGRVGPCSSWK